MLHNDGFVSFSSLSQVIDGGYCIGCGACAALHESPVTMIVNEYGQIQASVDSSRVTTSPTVVLTRFICPFGEGTPDEDTIARQIFDGLCKPHPQIGYYLETYAGYVAKGTFREQGSSGGMVSWLLCELLAKNLVTGVIHVHPRIPTQDNPRLFTYRISINPEEVRAGAKSRYYPIELSDVIRRVSMNPGKYAFVGLPCFVKALRLLMLNDPVLSERIHFCIGLVCGHLKSMRFAEAQAWQCGIKPDELISIDFRKKLPNTDANRYGIEVVGYRSGQIVTEKRPIDSLYASSWDFGLFKYKACDYCDDVFSEVADIAVGDAWLPQYITDSRGTNIIVIRNPVLQSLVEEEMMKGTLVLDRLSPDSVALSQAGGLRHRRDGLAYRLYRAAERGEWYPPKRVQPSVSHLSEERKQLYDLRIAIAAKSHLAFKRALDADDFSVFVQEMDPVVRQYIRIARPSVWQRMKNRFQFMITRARKGL